MSIKLVKSYAPYFDLTSSDIQCQIVDHESSKPRCSCQLSWGRGCFLSFESACWLVLCSDWSKHSKRYISLRFMCWTSSSQWFFSPLRPKTLWLTWKTTEKEKNNSSSEAKPNLVAQNLTGCHWMSQLDVRWWTFRFAKQLWVCVQQVK